MPTIKLLMKSGPHKAGDEIEVAETRARWFLAHKLAVRVVKEEEDAEDDAEDETEDEEQDDREAGEDDESANSNNGETGSLDFEEGSLTEDYESQEEVAPPPNLKAPVQEWARYAIARGMPAAEARQKSKRELIETYRK